jgi:hypothetical protein
MPTLTIFEKGLFSVKAALDSNHAETTWLLLGEVCHRSPASDRNDSRGRHLMGIRRESGTVYRRRGAGLCQGPRIVAGNSIRAAGRAKNSYTRSLWMMFTRKPKGIPITRVRRRTELVPFVLQA